MKTLHVVGARPNFMKAAPIMREMTKYPQEFEQLLVHTGQRYGNGTLLLQHVEGVLRGRGSTGLAEVLTKGGGR